MLRQETGCGTQEDFHLTNTGGFVRGGRSGLGVKLTTYHCLVPKLRMSGAIPLLPYFLPYHAQEQLYLTVCYMALVLKSSFSFILGLIKIWRISNQ